NYVQYNIIGTVPVIYENLTRFSGEKNFSQYKIFASGLLRYYQDTCANGNHDGYDNEFGNILSTESIKAASSTDAALLAENKPKNRFKNILPYDSYRVVLNDGRPGGDYINASYINCHDVPRKFIASQGPTPRTIQDFWRMVWQDEVAVVVMLTNVTEGGKRKCEKYWPEPNETLTFGPFEVKAKEEEYYGCYVVRTFEVANKDNVYESAIRTLKHFQYVTWPDHGVPVSTTGFYRLHTHVMEEHNSAGNAAPIVVHCSAGVGRTGTFIGFDCLVRMIEDKAAANVFETVLNMRRQRTDMVQTKAQYALLYKLITETYVLKNTDFAGEELDEKIANLTRTNRSTHKSGFEVEFGNTDIIEPLTTTKTYPPGQDNGINASDIVSYKHSQVLLPPMPGDTDLTYYNASTILGYGKSETAIAAQGPIRHDMVEKFWLAITSLHVRTIVMLNNFFENDTVQCHDYFPTCVGDSKQYGDTTVRLASCDTSDNITSRKLQVIKDKIQASNFILIKIKHRKLIKFCQFWSKSKAPNHIFYTQMEINHYQLSGWPDKGVPRTCESVLDLAAKTQTSSQQQGGGVLVHCSDGSGRTGTFLAIINVIERIKNENQIDVFRTVKDLRDSRPGMVSNLQQYKFIYDTGSAYMRSFATYDNFTPAVRM
ncbi:receptor-type tyrosine-protein phosphatase epsilon-like, partial [Ciona intestinalis]